MGAPVLLLPSPFTEPSAVAPDPKVYFDVTAPKIKEFTEAGDNLLRTQVDLQHPALPRSVL